MNSATGAGDWTDLRLVRCRQGVTTMAGDTMNHATWKATLTAFLSYSHVDKRVARRIVRRLTAHGIRVWIDERELRVGATLTTSIRKQIHQSDVVLVIVSKDSEISKWVELEVEFARGEGKVIIPIFIDAIEKPKRFQDMLGIDGASPQAFAEVIDRLIRDLFGSLDLEVPPVDRAILTTGLRDLAREEPDLAPLITGCLDSEGLNQESIDTVSRAAFHPLDDALNSLFDLTPSRSMAEHAAFGFRLAGAGIMALSSWVAATGDGGLPLDSAVGRTLDPSLFAAAIKLLGACDPPNNQALCNFVDHNAAQLDPGQQRAVLRLVTWPMRRDAGNFADVLGWVAMKNFPDAIEIQQMWSRWIESGSFDGKPNSPADLARYLSDASKKGLRGWDSINNALRSHVRTYLRSGDKGNVVIAADHIMAAADQGAPVLQILLREADGVSGTAEWKDWEQSDRETAEWMRWFVFEVAKEARGDRDWNRAWDGAKEMVAFQKLRRQLLNNDG
jgi:hypothetical protein